MRLCPQGCSIVEGVSHLPPSQGLGQQDQQGRISSPPSLLKRLPLDAARYVPSVAGSPDPNHNQL